MNANDTDLDLYKAMILKSPFGIVHLKAVVDQHEKLCDYIFVDVNAEFEKILATNQETIIGKKVMEHIPITNSEAIEWLENFQKLKIDGEALESEQFFAQQKKWYKVYAYAINQEDYILTYIDITDEKAESREVNEANYNYISILEGTNIGTWIWYVQSGKTIFNERWAEMLGLTLAEISPVSIETWVNYTHPDDLAIAQKELDKVFAKEIEFYSVEFRMKHKDGHYIWVHDQGSVSQWSEDGEPIVMSGSHTDISYKMEAQEALIEAEWKFKALFEKGPIGVAYHRMIYDEAGNPVDYFFIDANKAYQDLTGVIPNGRTVLEAFPGIENDPADWIGTFGRVAKTGEEIRFESYLEPNNSWYDVVGYQYKPDHFVAAFNNITDRKLAEQATEEEKERLAVTLRSIGDGVITTDTDGHVLIMNRVAEGLTGWKQEDAIGQPIATVFNIIHEATREPHENPVQKVISTGGILELANHTVLVSKNGSERSIADSGAPIRDKNSTIIGVVLVFRDMTEKQRLLDNMQRIDKLDSLGILAGGIAHDFNNLLSGIFGYIEMALNLCEENSLIRANLEKSLTVFERAKDLTQQLLTFSKGGVPKREIGQLGNLVKETATFVLSGAKIKCKYNIPDDLWLCNYDKNQISQVIDNIIINAQQAMSDGGTIRIAGKNIHLNLEDSLPKEAGNYVVISIEDTGSGIPREIIKSIFDPFFSTKATGNGLGLATCYSIIEKHDGYIDVLSVVGEGTKFEIYLPAFEEEFIEDITKTHTHHRGHGSILIMDDEAFIVEIVGHMVEDMGYSFIKAKDGKEVLLLAQKAQDENTLISAAIFDLTIPGGMGGNELIPEFRKIYPSIPVFASSGFSEDPTIARPSEYGFTDSIRKPFRYDELKEMFAKHIIII